ncbi:hypothetical protein X474_00185 [Dethiosulfatarculus sandiegensis]|uniref:Glycosyltransferase RgtA/B/C/D-like domain-containing protein n=1 Tax=Dethiosulfatarculus sandiegensis TaxID=1429043 RepID=A0A0D2JCY3_9BACT|nr:hypothetical protein X474_00185 [Dethiosulfatarculus sandiegensis]
MAALVRGAFLVSPPMDSDIAVVGLMGIDALNGKFSLMYWGQHYGGSLEALTAAVFFKLFGVSSQALNAAPALYSLIFLALLYFVGKEIKNRRVGLTAVFLAALGPFYSIWYSTVARGLHAELLAFGALIILLCLKAVKDHDKGSTYAWICLVFGLVCGLAFWNNFLIAYFIIPCFLYMWRANLRLIISWSGLLMALGFIVGSAPLLFYNLQNDWGTLHFLLSHRRHTGFASNLSYLFFKSMPVLVGSKYDHSYQWVIPFFSPLVLGLSAVTFLGTLPFFAKGLWQSLKTGKSQENGGLLLLCLIFMVLIFCRIGGGDINSHRYFLSFFVIWPLFAAWIFDWLLQKSKKTAPFGWAIVIILAFSNLYGSLATAPLFDPGLREQRLAKVDHSQKVIDHLLAKKVYNAYCTEYWDSHRLSFQSKAKVNLVLPFKERRPQNQDILLRSQQTGFITPKGKAKYAANLFKAMGATFQEDKVAGYVIFRDIKPPELQTEFIFTSDFESWADPDLKDASQAWDLNAATGWRTRGPQKPGQTYLLDLGQVEKDVCQIMLSSSPIQEKPNKLEILTSADKITWQTAAMVSETLFPAFWSAGKPFSLYHTPWQEIRFAPRDARYIKLVQTGKSRYWWSMPELLIGRAAPEANLPDLQKAAAWVQDALPPEAKVYCQPGLRAFLPFSMRPPEPNRPKPAWLADHLRPHLLISDQEKLYFALPERYKALALEALASAGWGTDVKVNFGICLITAKRLHKQKPERILRRDLKLLPAGKGLVADLGEPLPLTSVALNGIKDRFITPHDLEVRTSPQGKSFGLKNLHANWPGLLYWTGLLPLPAKAFPLRLELTSPGYARYLKLDRVLNSQLGLPPGLRMNAYGSRTLSAEK